jgi:hypothetical protein
MQQVTAERDALQKKNAAILKAQMQQSTTKSAAQTDAMEAALSLQQAKEHAKELVRFSFVNWILPSRIERCFALEDVIWIIHNVTIGDEARLYVRSNTITLNSATHR